MGWAVSCYQSNIAAAWSWQDTPTLILQNPHVSGQQFRVCASCARRAMVFDALSMSSISLLPCTFEIASVVLQYSTSQSRCLSISNIACISLTGTNARRMQTWLSSHATKHSVGREANVGQPQRTKPARTMQRGSSARVTDGDIALVMDCCHARRTGRGNP